MEELRSVNLGYSGPSCVFLTGPLRVAIIRQLRAQFSDRLLRQFVPYYRSLLDAGTFDSRAAVARFLEVSRNHPESPEFLLISDLT